jgi:hypothetical protein
MGLLTSIQPTLSCGALPSGLWALTAEFLVLLVAQPHRPPIPSRQGDEAVKVSAFKEALGLVDEDAAPVHIEVGRRLMREGFETKDRNAVFEKRKVREGLPGGDENPSRRQRRRAGMVQRI